MPAHNGLGTHDNESVFPAGPKPSRQHPEDLVEYCEPRPGTPSFQRHELLTKNEVFEKQTTTCAEKAYDCSDQEPNGVHHASLLSYFPCRWQHGILLKSQADRILASDTAESKSKQGPDTTTPSHAESLLAAEKRTQEMMANGASLSDVLNDLCVAIDAHAPLLLQCFV